MSPEIRELTLSKGKFDSCVLYKLKKRWVLRYRLGPDCLAEDVALYTNYPPDGWVPSRNICQIILTAPLLVLSMTVAPTTPWPGTALHSRTEPLTMQSCLYTCLDHSTSTSPSPTLKLVQDTSWLTLSSSSPLTPLSAKLSCPSCWALSPPGRTSWRLPTGLGTIWCTSPPYRCHLLLHTNTLT